MSPSDLSISKMGPESDGVPGNLLEHYLRDRAEWFAVETKTDGSYSYDTSLIWQNGYDAYFATVGLWFTSIPRRRSFAVILRYP